tara:strand:+ start:200 stop:712 length:513 start_codon:yes stop_codon:yes gene_type:complete
MDKYFFKYDDLGFKLITNNDTEDLIRIDCDPEVRSFFPDGTVNKEDIPSRIKKYQEDYNKQGYGCFLVFNLKNGNLIGRAGMTDLDSGETEVGYLIVKELWGKGYATKILKAILHWCKGNLKKDKIIAYTPTNHTASIRVMQKSGMQYLETKVMPHISKECVVYAYDLMD